MKKWSLLLLRISLGWLLVIWGIDKVVNVEHGVAIANKFYMGMFAVDNLIQAGGLMQVLVGLLVVLGLMRRLIYPILLLLNTATLVAVAQSVIDPWSWFFAGSNALFYPSLIIFAGSLVVMAWRNEDRFALDTLTAKPTHTDKKASTPTTAQVD
ncbi:DoxX family membrane protein [Pseudomonas sp. NPDC078700]|uniref:DoxX family membrane protein n=1 Tax=Pseudomonas sp. NPDC078700 TaxID=3364424 RepID=UPI0037CAF969